MIRPPPRSNRPATRFPSTPRFRVELEPRKGRQRPAPRLTDPGLEGLLQDHLRDRPALAARTRRRPHPLYRPGGEPEPLHPRRCREMGPAHAPLSRVGTRHQIALLSPLEIGPRSEEHTSELQSLMRISYAVFCLKKKKSHIIHYN